MVHGDLQESGADTRGRRCGAEHVRRGTGTSGNTAEPNALVGKRLSSALWLDSSLGTICPNTLPV